MLSQVPDYSASGNFIWIMSISADWSIGPSARSSSDRNDRQARCRHSPNTLIKCWLKYTLAMYAIPQKSPHEKTSPSRNRAIMLNGNPRTTSNPTNYELNAKQASTANPTLHTDYHR